MAITRLEATRTGLRQGVDQGGDEARAVICSTPAICARPRALVSIDHA